MPTPELEGLTPWLSDHWVALLVISVLAWIAFRGARPTIHRFLVRFMTAQRSA